MKAILLSIALLGGTANAQDSLNVTKVGELLLNAQEVAGVAVSGNYAYVAGAYSGLWVIDICIPTNPVVVGHYDTPGSAKGVAVSGSEAYVADGSSGLRVIDVSNPYSPMEIGYCEYPENANGVAVSGSMVYVTDAPFGGGRFMGDPEWHLDVGILFCADYSP